MKGNPMLDLAAADRLELSQDHATLLEERRKIPAEIAAQLGIVSQGKAIGFQYRHRGVLRFTKFRGPDKKFWISPVGVKLCLWNLDSLQHLRSTGGTLVLTEGEIDCASVVAAGYTCAASVPNGAPAKRGEGDVIPSTDSQFAYLWDEEGRLIPELGDAARIILATDADGPGQNLAGELALRLGPDRCLTVRYPAGCKDANDVLIKHGPDVLKDVLDQALPLVPDKLVSWSELPSLEQKRGLTTGWRDLDKHLLLTFPELIIITGKPGSGKSRWVMAWVLNLSRIHGVKVAFVGLEDSANRAKRHSMLYAKTWADQELSDPETGEVIIPIHSGHEQDWLDGHTKFMSPAVTEEDTRDLEWLKQIIWEAACRHDCKIIVIDPWNELEHMWARGSNESDYINAALRDLKRWCRRYSIALVIVAHPDKAGGRNESIEEMSLYSISGGAAWKNKADGGIIVGKEMNSEGETGNTIIKCDKRKDWDTMGSPGTVVLGFDSVRGIYTSIG